MSISNGEVSIPEIAPGFKKSTTSRYKTETGMAVEYTDKTWRPVQTVIDIVQNHLDANTTIYEKKLLETVGVTEYRPADIQQQQTVSLLNVVKYSTDREAIAKAQEQLQNIADIKLPELSDLSLQLKEINYQLPQVKLKLTDGLSSQFIDYDKVKNLSKKKWRVVGFRVDDQGAGFDNQLLGIIGGTTKSESSGKRGGLGEGLKMSVTHLVRSGASVRLLSRNGNELWTARPHVENGTINFRGFSRQEEDDRTTGSITDVDFSRARIDPSIVTALDPREGEGLGKYILDYRGPEFIPVVNNGSSELSSLGVPANRVYVRGLLVQERNDLLWSYNLGDKWAISGRDRKTIQSDILREQVKKSLLSLEDKEKLKAVFKQIKDGADIFEAKVLNGSMEIPDQKKELWQKAIAEMFNFIPKKTLFAPQSISTHHKRFAQQRGFKIIHLPDQYMSFSYLVKELYPEVEVSIYDLENYSPPQFKNTARIKHEPLFRSKPEPETKSKNLELDPQSEDLANQCKDMFLRLVSNHQRDRGIQQLPYISLHNLKYVRFQKADEKTYFESDNSQFIYDSRANTIHVRGDIKKLDFKTAIDMSVQFLKTLVGETNFNVSTQDWLCSLAAEVVTNLRPEILSELNISSKGQSDQLEIINTYSPQQQNSDKDTIAFYTYKDLLDKPGIARIEVEQLLSELRKMRRDKNFQSFRLDTFYFFDGKIYFADHSYELSKVTMSKNSFSRTRMGRVIKNTVLGNWRKHSQSESEYKQFPKRLLDPNESKYPLQGNMQYFLPSQLKDGESTTLFFDDGWKKVSIDMKRKGDLIIRKIREDKTGINITEAEFKRMFGKFNIGNNVITITPNTNTDIILRVEKNRMHSTEQISEVNRGESFLSSNITLDYGREVWSDPRRILLDAIQNHIDAKPDTIPSIIYTIVNNQGNIEKVTKENLQDRDKDWQIIGLSIRDNGEGYPTPYLTSLGKSTKDNENLGKYGEGLKMLATSAVRQGIHVQLSSRDWVAIPRKYDQVVTDYETGGKKTLVKLGYDLKWFDNANSFSQTYFSLLPISHDLPQLSQDQQRQIQTLLGNNQSTWKTWVDMLDPRNENVYGQSGLDRFVLPKKKTSITDGRVTLLFDRPGDIYERSLLIPEDWPKPKIFGYNIDETIINTRERNNFDKDLLDEYVLKYFDQLTDKSVMKHILETVVEDQGKDFYELQFFKSETMSPRAKALWKQAYFELFGEDAILSLKTLKGRFHQLDGDSIKESIEEEKHLEHFNLIHLPYELTSFFANNVYSSNDYRKVSEGADIKIPSRDKETLTKYIQSVNELMLTVLESIDSNPEGRAALAAIIKLNTLEKRKRKLHNIKSRHIRITHKSLLELGSVRIQNEPSIALNQKILQNAFQLASTYIHEASHYLPDEADYELGFQRFVMAIVLHNMLHNKILTTSSVN